MKPEQNPSTTKSTMKSSVSQSTLNSVGYALITQMFKQAKLNKNKYWGLSTKDYKQHA